MLTRCVAKTLVKEAKRLYAAGKVSLPAVAFTLGVSEDETRVLLGTRVRPTCPACGRRPAVPGTGSPPVCARCCVADPARRAAVGEVA